MPPTELRSKWLRYMAATERNRKARNELWDAIHQASADGMSVRAIAAELGLSHQRVAQILQEKSEPSRH